MADEEDRQKRLEASLSELKLQIRTDSQMCREYIQGKDISLDDVVQEMATMHYLYQYTTYKQDLEKAVEYLINSKGAFRGVWRMAAQAAKLIHVSRGMPTTWPWMEE